MENAKKNYEMLLNSIDDELKRSLAREAKESKCRESIEQIMDRLVENDIDGVTKILLSDATMSHLGAHYYFRGTTAKLLFSDTGLRGNKELFSEFISHMLPSSSNIKPNLNNVPFTYENALDCRYDFLNDAITIITPMFWKLQILENAIDGRINKVQALFPTVEIYNSALNRIQKQGLLDDNMQFDGNIYSNRIWKRFYTEVVEPYEATHNPEPESYSSSKNSIRNMLKRDGGKYSKMRRWFLARGNNAFGCVKKIAFDTFKDIAELNEMMNTIDKFLIVEKQLREQVDSLDCNIKVRYETNENNGYDELSKLSDIIDREKILETKKKLTDYMKFLDEWKPLFSKYEDEDIHVAERI